MNETVGRLTAYSADEFRARASNVSPNEPGADLGDHRLNPDLRDMIVRDDLRSAAVLIPVVDRADGATMILTQRTANLRTHSGQIAFPGGTIDESDGTPENAALRETWEEIGLAQQNISVVGRMPDYLTGSGFRIAPVLGVVRPDFELQVNPDEVEDAFEVPLSFLMNPDNHKRESRVWQGKERFYFTMPYGERFIWGVTAGIIHTLYERFYR